MNNNHWIWFDLDGTLYNLYKVPNWLRACGAKM